MSYLDRTLSVAPMMDWTDRHDRYFLRQISRHTLLYTEMVTTGAVINGDRQRLLGFDAAEHPIAVQLGGCDPHELSESARICQDFGYDEVNLNVGCPSDRVQKGRIGACLMAEPELVAECVSAMQKAVDIPVTVKTRIGIDDRDSYEELHDFVSQVAQAGCKTFIVHARKAWLKGLSPKENREIPPLHYDTVYQIKSDFPELEVIINGGIKTLEETESHLKHVDGVMIGREAYQNPYILADVDQRFFGATHNKVARSQVVDKMLPYIEGYLQQGGRLQHVVRHMLGLFHAQPGGKQWRRYLSENAHRSDAGIEVVQAALERIPTRI
ncbi:tRNA dihydrouridine(20/20a) synthase DusA [Pleionea sp. CnH1-48]|uniref:tRNA dihydrouridine(20/20a) synthase DusA n=1 Tax=Pleionea sp. CnH1-48 TaxID=2954494 RepID=UPI00209735BF|nr:tRNA dihydrouridine(20/20a) synthase DusA [Pleionea sp. CnH1-48]MCO7226438.1 tRNA dihydrouridine(20/20a) synthase DusA [Pleionea sp. CnH1-48]